MSFAPSSSMLHRSEIRWTYYKGKCRDTQPPYCRIASLLQDSLLAAGYRRSNRSFQGMQPGSVTIDRQLGVQVTRLLGSSHHPHQRNMTPGDLPQCSHGAEALAYHLAPHLSAACVLKPYRTENRDDHAQETQAGEREVSCERMLRQYLA